MGYLERISKTIVALATPPGLGGLAVVRISGKDALTLTLRVAPFLTEDLEPRRAYFGQLRSSSTDEVIDEAVVLYFQGPKSFTGEDVVEFSVHGSPVLVDWLLQELVDLGASAASPGEFSFRSFWNGRLNLLQAEGVLGLIHSESRQAAKESYRQLRGSLSKELMEIEGSILHWLAHLEASIDFSLEGLATLDVSEMVGPIQECREGLIKLLASYQKGRVLADGFRVAIVGSPNVGKSSLLNAILGEEKAIVTAAPGTTRDPVEGRVLINGHLVCFVDTAGLRTTTDEVEKIGMGKSVEAANSADLVLVLVPAGELLELVQGGSRDSLHFELAKRFTVEPDYIRVIASKADLVSEVERTYLEQMGFVVVSAHSSLDILNLRQVLGHYCSRVTAGSGAAVMHLRQFEGLKVVEARLAVAREMAVRQSPVELIALELREALDSLGELLGKKYSEQVMQRVFQEFCIGK